MKTCFPEDYRSSLKPTWCKGCSYYTVLSSLCEAFAEMRIAPDRLNIISGIGCSSRVPFYLSAFGMHTLHGRPIPVAAGVRMANPDLKVITVAGDGDIFSIGVGHFVHAARKNFDITVICLDNRMYAMTKNQSSPTSPKGYCGSLTPYGKISLPMNVLEFAIACNATFVAGTFAGAPEHMQRMFSAAIDHKGFSFVEVIAPCRTFDRKFTPASLLPRMVDINKTGNHDTSDRKAALAAAAGAFDYDFSDEAPIPIGVFLSKRAPTFEEQIVGIRKTDSPKESLSSILKKYSL